MKKLAYTIVILILSCSVMMAQDNKKSEKIRALKVGFITEKINLSQQQSSKFWPVYNRYQDELREIRRGFKDKYKASNPSADENTARKYVHDNIEYQQAELNLKKKYKDELLKTISAQQLAELYQAERDFKTMLLKQLQDEGSQKAVEKR